MIFFYILISLPPIIMVLLIIEGLWANAQQMKRDQERFDRLFGHCSFQDEEPEPYINDNYTSQMASYYDFDAPKPPKWSKR